MTKDIGKKLIEDERKGKKSVKYLGMSLIIRTFAAVKYY
jgi:hypothetical protein